MPIFRALLSALTLFGGHFLSRRIDRVVLIGALLMVVVVVYVTMPWIMALAGHRYDYDPFWFFFKLPLLLAGAIALLSAILTYVDARKAQQAPLTWTMRITGTGMSLVGFFVMFIAVYFVAFVTVTPPGSHERSSQAPVVTRVYRTFHAFASFGGGPRTFELPAPPSGPERLRGRIMLDGRGAEGVQLQVILNSKYKLTELRTDSRGIFEIPLPAGTWYVNHVGANGWEGQPEGRELLMFSGKEPRREDGHYRVWDPSSDFGLEVRLPSAPDAVALELELRDAIAMSWPPDAGSLGRRDGEEAVPTVELPNGTLAWKPVAAASEYQVQISHVTRDGDRTSYSPILWRRVPASELPLASLPQKAVGTAAAADEYSVQVIAFDAAGRFVSQSDADFNRRLFKLAGVGRLAREDQGYSSSPSQRKVISDEYETNELRLSLAAKLLDQRKFNEARDTLNQVSGDAPPGRATMLRGRLAALQGDCVTANKLFDQAEVEGGADCVPNEDRRLCTIEKQ
jgi:hypothetical protein